MEWISVKDRLPEREIEVVIVGSKFGMGGINGNKFIGWLEENNTWSYCGEFGERKDFNNNPDYHVITHWLDESESPKLATLWAERAEKLREALEDAKKLIRSWHSMGMNETQEKEMWNLYDNNAPEMKRLNSALTEKPYPRGIRLKLRKRG